MVPGQINGPTFRHYYGSTTMCKMKRLTGLNQYMGVILWDRSDTLSDASVHTFDIGDQTMECTDFGQINYFVVLMDSRRNEGVWGWYSGV